MRCAAIVFQTFQGNSDSEGVMRHELQQSIVARYVRFVPLQWSKEGRMGLRVEVYGCSYCEFTFMQTPWSNRSSLKCIRSRAHFFAERFSDKLSVLCTLTVWYTFRAAAVSPSHYHSHDKGFKMFLWLLLLTHTDTPQIDTHILSRPLCHCD